MTNPQFPDPLGMREVVRPGATASKAGPDMLQRVAALEQGALGRPGPEIANGCTITSDTSQTGGVKWKPGPFEVISERSGRYAAGIGTTGFVIGAAEAISYLATSGSSCSTFWIDPADWGTTGATVKLRVWCQTETDPTDSNLDATLYRLTGIGAAGTISSSTGIVSVTGFGVTAANSQYSGVSAEATITTAGRYFVLFAHNVNPAQAMTWGYTLMAKAAL